MESERSILSSDSLAGDPIKNRDGEKIADVKDMMIDLRTGRVAYIVVAYGGIMGLGDKFFAVPWSAVNVDQQDHSLIIDLDEEVLKKAPGFDKDVWPDFSSADWNRQIHEHYGLTQDWLQV